MTPIHFIFFVSGRMFLDTLSMSFKYFPKDAVMVILTNDVDYAKSLKHDINLIVADVNAIRDDWSYEYEDTIRGIHMDL